VRVLHRAIDILDCFSEREAELSVMEIVEKTGLDRSTARRLALTLCRRGLLRRTPTGEYQLGLRLFELGNIVSSSFSLHRAAAAQLAALETQVNGTILLAAWEGEYFIIVDKRETVSDGLSMVPMPSRVGITRPLTFGAIGRVLMSTLSRPAIMELIAKYPPQATTPYSITDVDAFLKALLRIKERGYEMEVNEVTEGILSFAVPVSDFSGQIVGALCIGLPSTREHDAPFLESTLARLKEAGAAVSANLGHRG
jgi:DNA-binding IclR family transcriptional regulator